MTSTLKQDDVEALYAAELKTTHAKIHRRATELMAYIDELEAAVLAFACQELQRDEGDREMGKRGLELLAKDGNTLHVRDSARSALEQLVHPKHDEDDEKAAREGLALLRKISKGAGQ